MKQKGTKKRENGFVIIVVLCMVIMMEVLLLGFNSESRNNLYAVEHCRKSVQALNYARAGLNIVIAAIRDNNDIVANSSLRDILSGESDFELGQGKCSVTVTEENGKLNLNLLKDKNGKLNRAVIEQLLRLIDLLNQKSGRLGISYGIVPAIIDWTDSDSEVTTLSFVEHNNSGAESSYYRRMQAPYSCKNAPLDTAEELICVKAITPQVFELMRDYVTVYGDGKININSAPKRVIESLSEKMDPVLARIIIERRKFKPFESIAELQRVPGMTESIYSEIKKNITVNPTDRYYYVASQANVGQIGCEVTVLLKRNAESKTVDVLLYKEI